MLPNSRNHNISPNTDVFSYNINDISDALRPQKIIACTTDHTDKRLF